VSSNNCKQFGSKIVAFICTELKYCNWWWWWGGGVASNFYSRNREHWAGEVSADKLVHVFPISNWTLVKWKKYFVFIKMTYSSRYVLICSLQFLVHLVFPSGNVVSGQRHLWTHWQFIKVSNPKNYTLKYAAFKIDKIFFKRRKYWEILRKEWFLSVFNVFAVSVVKFWWP